MLPAAILCQNQTDFLVTSTQSSGARANGFPYLPENLYLESHSEQNLMCSSSCSTMPTVSYWNYFTCNTRVHGAELDTVAVALRNAGYPDVRAVFNLKGYFKLSSHN